MSYHQAPELPSQSKNSNHIDNIPSSNRLSPNSYASVTKKAPSSNSGAVREPLTPSSAATTNPFLDPPPQIQHPSRRERNTLRDSLTVSGTSQADYPKTFGALPANKPSTSSPLVPKAPSVDSNPVMEIPTIRERSPSGDMMPSPLVVDEHDSSGGSMPLSNLPRHMKPTKQRTPTPYPMPGVTAEDELENDLIIEEAPVEPGSPLQPQGKRPSLSDSVTVSEEEPQDSTVRPKKKAKKTYSGLTDSLTPSPDTPAGMFNTGAGPFTGASEDGVEFQFGSANARKSHSGQSERLPSWNFDQREKNTNKAADQHVKFESVGLSRLSDDFGHLSLAEFEDRMMKMDETVRGKDSDKVSSIPKEEIPPRPSTPEPIEENRARGRLLSLPTIPSEPSSYSGSPSPPASLDIFNPFEPSQEEIEISNPTTEFSSRRSDSVSSSSTVLSETESFFASSFQAKYKWADAFDDQYADFSRTSSSPPIPVDSAHDFESPFFNDHVAKLVGSQIGLGLPSTNTIGRHTGNTIRLRGNVLGASISNASELLSAGHQDDTHEIVLNEATSVRKVSKPPFPELPSWDFGDESEEEAGLTLWEKANAWVTEPRQLINFAIGGSGLAVLCLSLYTYVRRH